jgi:acyl phosphate:glycerol-3-phosphate acyltransferase
MLDAVVIVMCYLWGSVPFGYIAGRLLKGVDIRRVGDGNVGAANVFHEIGPAAGLAVMLADIGKGIATVLVAQSLASEIVVFLAGFAVVIGHILPVYLGFRGGRGEATASGVLVVLLPQAMLGLLAIGLLPFIITRNTMLMGAILFVPLWLVAWVTGSPGMLVGYCVLLPCLVGLSHLLTTRTIPPAARTAGKYMR